MTSRSFPRQSEECLTSLVVPTYNPGPMLEATCRQLQEFLHESPGSWEILFVCDGCTDGSDRRLAEWSRSFGQQVRILSHTPNRGKGFAVRRGLLEAKGAWRLFTDVDLAYGLDDVIRVAQMLRGGADVVIASRTRNESRLALPPSLLGYAYRRHLQSQVLSRIVRWLLPLQVRDTQAGLKGLSARAAAQILPQLSCTGFGFDCELLTACVCLGFPIVEVPVCMRYEDRASTTSLRTVARLLREVLQIRRKWWSDPSAEPLALPELPRREAA
jgi:dolichyl-phosphate beta-glucosyltransferase